METTCKNFNCNLVLKNWKSKWLLALCFFGVFFTAPAFATDLLSGALADIKSNFGLGSVFIKALYLMEIYYGWRKYRETHNPFAVGSIVLVVMALTYAIGEWVNK